MSHSKPVDQLWMCAYLAAMKASHKKLLIDLLTLPTSPFNEQHVIAYIRAWAARRSGLQLTQDRFGNLQIRLQRGSADGRRPLVLAAHTDHPGFEAQRMLGRGRLLAIWRGGVAKEYFVGSKVRFYVPLEAKATSAKARKAGSASKPRWIRGIIQRVKMGDVAGQHRVNAVEVAVKGEVPTGAIGMWDFPDPVVKNSRLYARGCDDLAGVAAVLAAMDHLAESKDAVDVIAMLNRAEEVGFAGAMAACRDGLIPREARVISVECSSELAGGRMGEGPILRVGDWSTVFTPGLTDFCRRVAQGLAQSNRRFRFQRKLMDGGTCEGSAFLGYGYRATGLCIALGNYHNVDRRRGKIGPEFVDLNDWQGMVDWFVALALAPGGDEDASPELLGMLERLYQHWTPLLEATVERMMSPE